MNTSTHYIANSQTKQDCAHFYTDNVIAFPTSPPKPSNTPSTNNTSPLSLYTSDGRIKPSAADPVKDKATIQEIKNHLLNTGRHGYRNYLIFTVGINIGRRAGDLLKLTIGDVVTTHETINPHTNQTDKEIIYPISVKTEITHIEQKTGKRIVFYLNDTVRSAIKEYLYSIKAHNPYLPLFVSQKPSKFNPETMTREEDIYRLDTKAYWRILNQVKRDLDINLSLSTHTMRKTFGYHKYQEYKNKPIADDTDINVLDILQSAYGHSSRKQTLTYIGITKENKQKLYCETSL